MVLLAAVFGTVLLTGCDDELRKVYEQAAKDLEQEAYEYALEGYQQSIRNSYMPAQSYRGCGIALLEMGDYEKAIENFDSALGCEDINDSLKRDILAYRATARLKQKQYDLAMVDCQDLADLGGMNKETYYLSGKVALFMDSYDEAAGYFEKAYADAPSYETAIHIYEAYLEREMEADGTKYLEASLSSQPKTAEDYCDRGRIYYYMDDYDNARECLITASEKGNTEALILLGMVYLAQGDASNSRAMYQQFIAEEGSSAKGYNGLALCDIQDGNYEAALVNISNGKNIATTEELQSLMFNEAVVYERMQDYETAQKKMAEYNRLFPGDAAAEKELVFLKSRTGLGGE